MSYRLAREGVECGVEVAGHLGTHVLGHHRFAMHSQFVVVHEANLVTDRPRLLRRGDGRHENALLCRKAGGRAGPRQGGNP